MSNPYNRTPQNPYGYSNPYGNRPVPATPVPYQSQQQSQPTNQTVALDAETFKRFKNMELNHVTVTSSLEQKIKDLTLENQRILEQAVTKESVISELEAQKKRIYDDLVRERTERQSEREQWARTAAKNPGFDTQQYNQVLMQLKREREANEMLDALIKKEREANRMLDNKIQEVMRNQTYTAQHGIEEVNRLKRELEVERATNQEMERKYGVLKGENEVLRSQPASAASGEVETLKLQLEAERKANIEMDRMILDLRQQVNTYSNLPKPIDVGPYKDRIQELEKLLSEERHRFEQNLRTKTTEIATLQREIGSLQQDSVSVRNISDKYEQQLRQLNVKINEEQQRSWAVNEELRKAVVEIERLQATLASSDPSQGFVRKAAGSGGKALSKLPPKGIDPELWQYFRDSDKTGAGELDADELRVALSKGKWPPLSLKTAWFLLRLDKNGDFVPIESFTIIWEFIENCKKQFVQLDQAKQSETVWGQVSGSRLDDALKGMGLKVPSKAVTLVLRKRGQESILVSCRLSFPMG
jgi:hypothetical protein